MIRADVIVHSTEEHASLTAPSSSISPHVETDHDGNNDADGKSEADVKRFSTLKWLHFSAFLFMGIQTLAYGAIGVDAKVYPTIGLGSGCDGPICLPGMRQLDTMNPLWIIVLFCALASADHLASFLYAVINPADAKRWVFTIKSNPFRWIEYSISASIMAIGISILSGIHDIHLWFLIFFGHAVGMMMGQVLEFLPSVVRDDGTGYASLGFMKKFIFGLGCVSIFVPWLVMLCYFFSAVQNSPDGVPDFVYAAFLVTLLLFITFGINSLLHNVWGKYDFATAELVYICLSFTAKTFLAADVFGGLRAAEN